MTKKHFNKLAGAILKISDSETRREMATTIGAVCAEINRSFDWHKWSTACGVDHDEKR
jgi:hypothetical protein